MLFKTYVQPFSVAKSGKFITYYTFYRRFPDIGKHLGCVLQERSWAILPRDSDLFDGYWNRWRGITHIASIARRNDTASKGAPHCMQTYLNTSTHVLWVFHKEAKLIISGRKQTFIAFFLKSWMAEGKPQQKKRLQIYSSRSLGLMSYGWDI